MYIGQVLYHYKLVLFQKGNYLSTVIFHGEINLISFKHMILLDFISNQQVQACPWQNFSLFNNFADYNLDIGEYMKVHIFELQRMMWS